MSHILVVDDDLQICELLTEVEIPELKNLRISPNPFDDYIVVDSDKPFNETIYIFDLAGRLVNTTFINGQQQIINTKDFVQGVYFLKIPGEHPRKLIHYPH